MCVCVCDVEKLNVALLITLCISHFHLYVRRVTFYCVALYARKYIVGVIEIFNQHFAHTQKRIYTYI